MQLELSKVVSGATKLLEVCSCVSQSLELPLSLLRFISQLLLVHPNDYHPYPASTLVTKYPRYAAGTGHAETVSG